jgi:hypothetical protein
MRVKEFRMGRLAHPGGEFGPVQQVGEDNPVFLPVNGFQQFLPAAHHPLAKQAQNKIPDQPDQQKRNNGRKVKHHVPAGRKPFDQRTDRRQNGLRQPVQQIDKPVVPRYGQPRYKNPDQNDYFDCIK